MGCNIHTRRLDPKKVKTSDDVRKFFKLAVEAAREEFGTDQYSGEWNTLSKLVVSGFIYDTFDEASEYLEQNINKGDAVAARVKVIRVTKPMERLSQEIVETARARIPLRGNDPEIREQDRRLAVKLVKLRQRYGALEKAQAAKSNKTSWVICAACRE